jgi:hypothetical protein
MNPTHAVTQVAVIRHREHGVLLVHSKDRGWHLPDATLGADDDWLHKLQREIASATGITDFQIDGVLRIDTFAAGVVGDEPHYGVFLACSTSVDDVPPDGHEDDYRWMGDRADFDGLRDQLFNPLIEQLVISRLKDETFWPLQLGPTGSSDL